LDLGRFSKDTFKRLLGDLTKNEDYVVEITETKQIRGGKLPAIIYTIIIMDPAAVDLKELEKMKKLANVQQQGPQQIPPKQELRQDEMKAT